MQETRSHQKSTDATIQNLEVQIGQLAQEKAERPTITFEANTEKNPKEKCKAVLTRSQKRAQEEGEVEEDQFEEGRTNRDEEKEEEKKEEEGEKKAYIAWNDNDSSDGSVKEINLLSKDYESDEKISQED